MHAAHTHLTAATIKNVRRHPGMPPISSSPAQHIRHMKQSRVAYVVKVCAPAAYTNLGAQWILPKFVAKNDPPIPPSALVRYRAPNALPREAAG